MFTVLLEVGRLRWLDIVELRYMDLIWSLSLIGRLIFEWHMAIFLVQSEHQNDACYDDIDPFEIR